MFLLISLNFRPCLSAFLLVNFFVNALNWVLLTHNFYDCSCLLILYGLARLQWRLQWDVYWLGLHRSEVKLIKACCRYFLLLDSLARLRGHVEAEEIA